MTTNQSSLSRRSFVKAAGAAAAAALLADLGISASGARFALAADGGSTFTYAIAGDPGSNVNPVTTNDRFGLMTLKLVFSQLFTVRSDGYHWYLADSYEESEDHLEFTLHLHEGVKWTDGEPFTADDVVFTYQTIESNEDADAYSSLNYGDDGKVEVEAIDDLTVKFTFPFVNAAALEKLQGPDGVFIMPKHIYEGVSDFENNDVNANPVGCGAFTIAEYQVGSYLQFAANPDYFKGAPSVDNVVFQIITNESTGMQAIQTGEVDAWIATSEQVSQMDIQGNGLTVTPYSENRVAYITFNAQRVTDASLRKALFYSFDKKAIADAAVGNEDYYDLEYTFLPTTSEFYNPDAVEKYERDLDKAKQLLSEAGQTSPTFVVAYNGSDSLQTNACLLMQEQAAEAGITLDLRGLESAALSKAQRDASSEYDITFGGYIMGIDPDTYSSQFTGSSGNNYSHLDDATIDDLFEQGRVETDNSKRHDIYDQLQAAIQDAGAFYPLYSNDRLLVTGGRVGGIEDATLIPIYTFEDYDKLTVTD